MPRICVLSGDLINSSGLPPGALDRAMDALRAGADEIASWAPDLTTGFARSSGDGWKFVISDQRFGLRSSLFFRAVLRREGKALATRIALASGGGTLPADGNPNAASGPAFTASGRLLDTLTGPHITMADAAGGTGNALILLADHISQDWTPAQARALCQMLPPGPPTHAETAARLGVSRQAVDQALSAAGYHAISAALQSLEGVS